jgi:hypothetical protein
MLTDLSWRNLALFLAALVVASCLMAGAVIIAVDRLLYAYVYEADDQPAIKRPTI